MKKCFKCKMTKSRDDFYCSKASKDNLTSYCKECLSLYAKSKHISNIESSKEYRKSASLKFREKNFELNMLLAIKSSAKKRNLEFDLTIEDIVIPEFCPYLNIPLTKSVGKGKCASNPSIDRVDNTVGYLKNNIEIISDSANSMKRDATIDQLLIFAQNVIRKYGK